MSEAKNKQENKYSTPHNGRNDIVPAHNPYNIICVNLVGERTHHRVHFYIGRTVFLIDAFVIVHDKQQQNIIIIFIHTYVVYRRNRIPAKGVRHTTTNE